MTSHKVHSINTHTLPNAKALEPEESQSYRHFLQLHWKQNH